ncbi:MAG: GAF domain-containing sensor histidine kinase, partial [Bacteroidetes bacterium]|nr:GAF domain-containing sensor histidine kinase [Bacteroidota bacterium]
MNNKEREITAMLEASKAILGMQDFNSAAVVIFKACKSLIGAKTGYFSLLSEEGTENKVSFPDTGRTGCAADTNSHIPDKGIRAEAYKTGEVRYNNDFKNSEYNNFLPKGHAELQSVLFAPVKVHGKTMGLIGLGNKPGGFTKDDARIAGNFGEYAAIALLRSKIIEKLKNSEKKLKERNEELRNIIYITSHDLRSPLINIQGFSKQIEKDLSNLVKIIGTGPDKQFYNEKILPVLTGLIPEYFSYIYESTDKMDMLIKGLLKLSRIGISEINPTTVDMNSLIESVLKTFEFKIKKINAQVITEQLPDCLGDISLMNQIFSNLIDNAIKYRDHQRKLVIRISGSVKNNNSIYVIEDNGIGIDKKYSKDVYNIFFQADRRTGGEGLGLTIIKKILDLLNGSVTFESEKGRGSRFFVTIPARM